MAKRKVELVIVGDSKDGQKAITDMGDKTDGLSSKFGGLGKAGAVAFGLVAAGALALAGGVFEIGNTFDGAYDSIAITTGAMGSELEGLEQSFKDVLVEVPSNAEDSAIALGLINQKLDLTGDALEARSIQLLNLARIIDGDITTVTTGAVDMLNNWGVAANDQEVTLDRLFRVTQQTGIGWDELTSSLASNGVVLRASGLGIDESAALLGTLSKNGLDATDVTKSLSRSLASAAEDGVSASDAFGGILTTIRNAPDLISAQSYAWDKLGPKAGPQFAQLVREGKVGYEDLLATVMSGESTINGTADATADFQEKWDKVKNQVFVAMEPLATKLFDAVGDGMEWVSTYGMPRFMSGLDKISAWWDVNGPTIIATAEQVWTGIQRGVTFVVTTVETYWPRFQSGLDKFRAGMTEAGAVISGVVTWITDWVITPAVAFITFLWDALGTDLINIAETAWGFVTTATDSALKMIHGTIEFFTSLISGNWGGAWDGLKNVAAGAWDFIFGITEGTLALIGNVLQGVGSLLWDLIGRPFADAGKWIANGIIDGINKMVTAWNNLSLSMPSVDTPFGTLGGFTLNTPDHPLLSRFHDGGIVPGRTGEEVLALVQAGEGIIDADTMGTAARSSSGASGRVGGGNTYIFNIDVTGQTDPVEAGRTIVEVIDEYRNAGGTLKFLVTS